MNKQILLFIFLIFFSFSIYPNYVREYEKYKIVQYRDFSNRQYTKQVIRFILFVDTDQYIVNNKIKIKETLIYGFSIFGLYFCFSNQETRNDIFTVNFDQIYFATIYHNMGLEISEMANAITIKKSKNTLSFYSENKCIFEITF